MDPNEIVRALGAAHIDGHAVAAWSLYLSEARRTTVGTKDSETGNPHAPLTLTESLSGRYKLVWDDGLVSRGTLERRAIEREPGRTLATARASAYDDPDARDILGPAAFPEVATRDDGTAEIAAGGVAPLAARLAALRRRVDDAGIRTWSGSIQAGSGTGRVVTSSGLDVSASGTSASWSATLDGEIGNGLVARRFEPHDEFLSRLEGLIEVALALRQPAPDRGSGVVPVLLHPDVVEGYVLGALLHNLGGAQVALGTGAFRREQFGGAPVLREDLSLRTDPLVPMAAGSYRFSQEGLPAGPCVFIERGRLVAPLLDLKYARRLGLPANAAPAAMDTLFLEGSPSLTYEQALSAAAGGAIVLSVLGIHTQDFTSGDFSLAAPQTLSIGPRGVEGRRRATISGNVFDRLRSPELHLVRFPGEHTPGLLFPCRLDPA